MRERCARPTPAVTSSGFRRTKSPSTTRSKPTTARFRCLATTRYGTSPANWSKPSAATSPSTGPCARTSAPTSDDWSSASCASTVTRPTSRRRRRKRSWNRPRSSRPAGPIERLNQRRVTPGAADVGPAGVTPRRAALPMFRRYQIVVSSDEDRRHVTGPTEKAESPGRRSRHCPETP